MTAHLAAIAANASKAQHEIRTEATQWLQARIFNFDRETQKINRRNGQLRRYANKHIANKEVSK